MRIEVKQKTQTVGNLNRITHVLSFSIGKTADSERGAVLRVKERLDGRQLGGLMVSHILGQPISAERLQDRRNAPDDQRDLKRPAVKLIGTIAQQQIGMNPGYGKSRRSESR